MKTKSRHVCEVCGTLFADNSESCPVCALQGALKTESDSVSDVTSELRFEHYTVLQNADGTPLELGRGAMGVTYKAFDVHLRCPVALKIINARFIGDDLARHRFVREARAAASVRHQNVASVFHLGESGGDYFYVMEFVDGETLEKHIRRSGTLETDVALEVVAQVAAGLTAIQKQHLVHRDIKPSNIMVSWEEGRLDSVKIIDLGLAKGVAEDTISTVGSFAGTPAYASPEQFAGLGTDIRSDLYSLGITLWEMLSGKPPFQGSAGELLGQHQHAAPPIDKLKSVPAPVVALLQVLLAKDPAQRFQTPAQLRKALLRVREAVASGSPLSADELRSIGDKKTEPSKPKQRKPALRWWVVSGLCALGLLAGWFCFSAYRGWVFNYMRAKPVPTTKSIAVLPFENISVNKEEDYFADGVQDEILANVARISALKVISRTSVMQYRPDTRRDLRQIANALGVANILEGTVRRAGNRVRITIELVDAGADQTIWSEIYDGDLTDIFAIQSKVAQTIARKLTATLSPDEKKRIEQKPTDNLEAYDLYLQAKQKLVTAKVSPEDVNEVLLEAVNLLQHAVQLDHQFTMAYCMAAKAHDFLYQWYDQTSERRALGDVAVNTALRLQPDLPEVHLAYAVHLYGAYRDYDRARVQLEIAKRGLPNDTETILLEAAMDRRQGEFEKAIQEFHQAIRLDPRDTVALTDLAHTLFNTRRFRATEETFDRLIMLLPDQPMLKVEKAWATGFMKTGDDKSLRSAIESLPASVGNHRRLLFIRVDLALSDRNWSQAEELLQRMEKGDDLVGCFQTLLGRLQGGQLNANPSFIEHREKLNREFQASPANSDMLSRLAIVDAWLGNKEAAISEAKSAVEMLPISQDAIDGPSLVENLALAYAWTNEMDLAFQALSSLTKIPNGIYYGPMKSDPRWDPLRKDPRFDKLLTELAPRD